MTIASCTLSSCSPRRQPSAAVAHQAAWNEPSSALCHNGPPRPARRRRDSIVQNNVRRRATAPWMSSHSWVLIVLFSILICCQHVEAGKLHGSRRLTKNNNLVFDKRGAPRPHPRLESREEHKQSHKHVGKQKSNDTALLTDPNVPQESLPHPFDTSLGNNFTAPSCPTFFNNFLNSDDFNNCLPFSLLLQVCLFDASIDEHSTTNIHQTSSAFFAASQSLPRLTQTLDAACNVNYKQCSSVMSNLAVEIQQDENCGADFQMGNPIVTQAYTGLLAYQPSYHAGCLTDSDGNYCYANAVMNASAPSSSYVYYLPLGVSLPGGTQPTCDQCLKNTLSIFASYATNSSQPLYTDYGTAAQTIDMTCGPQFAASAVQTGAASSFSVRTGLTSTTAAFILSAFLF